MEEILIENGHSDSYSEMVTLSSVETPRIYHELISGCDKVVYRVEGDPHFSGQVLQVKNKGDYSDLLKKYEGFGQAIFVIEMTDLSKRLDDLLPFPNSLEEWYGNMRSQDSGVFADSWDDDGKTCGIVFKDSSSAQSFLNSPDESSIMSDVGMRIQPDVLKKLIGAFQE